MSHYARALARSLSALTPVALIDGASGLGPLRTWRNIQTMSRGNEVRLLNTSPHWSVPLILAGTRLRGGYVMHGPLVYLASRWTRPLYVAYYRFVTRRLGVVVLHASRFRSSLESLRLSPRQVVVVPHGFVPEGLAGGGNYDATGPFVCVGRMLPYKGFDVFVEALRRLALAGSPVPAVIGGEGVTESVAPGGVPGLVVKAGELSDEVFRDTIDRCAAVVLPYRKATQSGVLSTAFAAGRPVIATDVGSFPDYVDASNGALLKPGDPQELADTIAALRNDQERSERLARGARRTWEERLNPDAAAREILDALGR